MQVGGHPGRQVIWGVENTDGVVPQQIRFESRQQGGFIRVRLAPLRGNGRLVFEVDKARQAQLPRPAILRLGNAGAIAPAKDAHVDLAAVHFVQRGTAGVLITAAKVLHAHELCLAQPLQGGLYRRSLRLQVQPGRTDKDVKNSPLH